MADNDDAKKEEPKKHEWWLSLLIGIAMLGGSVFIYFDLTKFEQEGGERRMHWLAVLLYEWLGKWGLVGVIILMGLAMTIYGIIQTSRRFAGKDEIKDEEEPLRRRRPQIDEEYEEPRPRKRPPPVEDLDQDRPRPRKRLRDED